MTTATTTDAAAPATANRTDPLAAFTVRYTTGSATQTRTTGTKDDVKPGGSADPGLLSDGETRPFPIIIENSVTGEVDRPSGSAGQCHATPLQDRLPRVPTQILKTNPQDVKMPVYS